MQLILGIIDFVITVFFIPAIITIMILGFIEDIFDKYYDYKKKKLQRK